MTTAWCLPCQSKETVRLLLLIPVRKLTFFLPELMLRFYNVCCSDLVSFIRIYYLTVVNFCLKMGD